MHTCSNDVATSLKASNTQQKSADGVTALGVFRRRPDVIQCGSSEMPTAARVSC